jgi:hypothetical protein
VVCHRQSYSNSGSSKTNFGSIFAYAHVIKVSASSFHNVSLTSVGAATVKGELCVVGFLINFLKDCAAACGLCGFVGYNCSIEVLREQYGYLT